MEWRSKKKRKKGREELNPAVLAALEAQRQKARAESPAAPVPPPHQKKRLRGLVFDRRRNRYFRPDSRMAPKPAKERKPRGRRFRFSGMNMTRFTLRRQIQPSVAADVQRMTQHQLAYIRHETINSPIHAITGVHSHLNTTDLALFGGNQVNVLDMSHPSRANAVGSWQSQNSQISSVSWMPEKTKSILAIAELGSQLSPGQIILQDFSSDYPSVYNTIESGSIWCIEWNPYNLNQLSVGSSSSPVHILDFEHCKKINCPSGQNKSDVISQEYNNKGNCIVNGTRNGSAWIWDVRGGVRAIENCFEKSKNSSICRLKFLQDSFKIIVGYTNGLVSMYDMRSFQKAIDYYGNSYPHCNSKFSLDPTETFLVNGGPDSFVHFWDIRTGQKIYEVDISDNEKDNSPYGIYDFSFLSYNSSSVFNSNQPSLRLYAATNRGLRCFFSP